MKKYEVTLEIVVTKTVKVRAEDSDDAYSKVLDMYSHDDYSKADKVTTNYQDSNNLEISVTEYKTQNK